jgi:hypothetical protein
MTKGEKISKKLQGNKNAEKWDFNNAEKLMNEALELSFNPEYDFVGEICQKLKIARSEINYFADKFPELKSTYNKILGNCEANCFRNAKKGNIKEATAIVNLKSNHGWTDRQQIEIPNIQSVKYKVIKDAPRD